MTRRLVTVGVTASNAATSTTWHMCPDCSLLVELNGDVFKRHGYADVLCRQSGKYPPPLKAPKP
jgi:hypothetical protein